MKQNYLCTVLNVAVVFGLVFAPRTMPAQETATDTNQLVSLQTLVDEAWKKNPEIRVAEATIAAARGEAVTAYTRPNPELGFAPGMKRISEGSDLVFSGALQLKQVIEFPGKRELRKAIAERNVSASKLALETLHYQIELAVRKAHYTLLAAQQVVSLRAEQVQSARVFVEASRKRTAAGYASDFEVVKAEADLVAAQKVLREAQGRIASATVALNTFVGRPSSAPLKVAGSLDGGIFVAPTNILDFALRNNPAVRVQRVQVERAGLNVKASKLSRRPDFTVGPEFELGQDEQVFRFGVSVPLPFWNKKKGEIQTAIAEQNRAEAEVDRLQFEIVRAVKVGEENLRTANDQLALYTPEFRDRLKALVQQAEKSYAQSATTLLIYLDARRTYFDTLADYNEALARAAEARADIESAAGVPLNFTTPNP
jgi:cobalt-zinc-cadmium efflux system outer membrane protein